VSRCNITLCNTSSITSDWVSDCPGQTDRSASGGCGTATVFLSSRDVLDECCNQASPHVLDPIIPVRPAVCPGAGGQGIPSTRHRGTRIGFLSECSVLGEPNGLANMGVRVNIRSAGREAAVANGA